ncbi:unnamed protein product [Gongylonema pulchrum]|uniref:Uncharacterized protein n=1 Tax=Gongylonema pulchrum TaxID=637853 RepID=A0A183CYX4_9BILA|nr:unnamed protein product [Gongylonema pulchrum]
MVVAPGFMSDCLETIEELEHELARIFRSAKRAPLRTADTYGLYFTHLRYLLCIFKYQIKK